MVVAAADIAEQSGVLSVEEGVDGGWREVSTGVQSYHSQPTTPPRQELLHHVP